MYDYETEKAKIDFATPESMKSILAIRDKTKEIAGMGGAALLSTLIKVVQGFPGSFEQIAHVDRAAELGLITEITASGDVMGQHRVFV